MDDDLSNVPGIALNEPFRRDAKLHKNLTKQFAAIVHLHQNKRDSFIDHLVEHRPDLAGLPFLKGAACRPTLKHIEQFVKVRQLVFDAASNAGLDVNGPPPSPEESFQFGEAHNFWLHLNRKLGEARDEEGVDPAKVAVLMQMCGPETAVIQKGMVKALRETSHVDATRALAKLALFAPQDDVRRQALAALKIRREKDYTDLLLDGLKYPWPAVARRAAEAIVKLERHDLIPALVDSLDAADPRLPKTVDFFGKKMPVLRELVRVNHHRNCLLCHAPSNLLDATVLLQTPVPSLEAPLSPNSNGYGEGNTLDLAVRIDVTYLRQDFSLMQRVLGDEPWPEMQRFDFLVRERVLGEEEADAYRKALAPRDDGTVSPYHRAALYALRELTGRDTEPSAAAWRKLLKLAGS
jgi:hypothetical protein